MRIAVAYQDGQIGEHFGHAEMFAIYEYADADVNRCTKRLVETKDKWRRTAKVCRLCAHLRTTWRG